MPRYVAYYRVSLERQARSGLGLEAQEASVTAFVASDPTSEIVGRFVETESGKNNDRKQLRTALRDCRLKNATLIIARLDRLSRDAGFLMTLQNAGTDFVALDARYADKAMIGVMAIMAQKEREAISERTSAALRAAKARGVKLGTPANFTTEVQAKGREVSRAVRTAAANERAASIFEVIEDIRASGVATLDAIAAELNARRFKAPRGGAWSSGQLSRVLKRVAA